MSIILSLLFIAAGALLFWRMDRRLLTYAPEPRSWRLGVIIPARNEATRLTPLLKSLVTQTLKPDVVLVVDDNSTDDTAALAHSLGATVISAGPKPLGWTGKTWACWLGAQHAQTDILVFFDADVWLEPTALEALVHTYLQRGGLLSVQPYHVTRRFYEQFAAIPNLVVVGSLAPLGRKALGGAFGPCMVCRREDYFRVGGHQAVRGEAVEDIPLGKNFERAKLPVSAYLGKGFVNFRMYPNGFRDLIEGYSKGLAFGALAVRPLATFLLIAWITGGFSISANVMRALVSPPLNGRDLVSLLFYLAYAAQLHWALRYIGRFRTWVAPLFPIPLLFFAGVMLQSLIMTYIVGEVRWKGQTIATRPRKRRQL